MSIYAPGVVVTKRAGYLVIQPMPWYLRFFDDPWGIATTFARFDFERAVRRVKEERCRCSVTGTSREVDAVNDADRQARAEELLNRLIEQDYTFPRRAEIVMEAFRDIERALWKDGLALLRFYGVKDKALLAAFDDRCRRAVEE